MLLLCQLEVCRIPGEWYTSARAYCPDFISAIFEGLGPETTVIAHSLTSFFYM